MTPDRTTKTLKGAAVFFARRPDKRAIEAAQQAGALVVAELTPNTHIMVGDGDNQLVDDAEEKGVEVWSESDFLTAASPAPPPPPSSGSSTSNLKKTIYVRRFPALPGDVSWDDGLAAPLAYSWYVGASSAEIESGLRQLVGAGSDQLLNLLTASGGTLTISSALPNGVVLTLRVADVVEAFAPPAHLLDELGNFEVGPCTVDPRPAADENCGKLRRSMLPPTLCSAIHKRRREVSPDPRWCDHVLAVHEEIHASTEDRPDKMRKTKLASESAAEMLTTPIADVLASLSKVDEEAALKLAEERGALAHVLRGRSRSPVADEAAEADEGGQSGEAGVARLRKMVAAVQTVVTTVAVGVTTAAKKVNAMQKKTAVSRPPAARTSATATPAALRKRVERWMPLRSTTHTAAEEPLMSQQATPV